MNTLRTGDLAYYDSFTGLIPCKVLSIHGSSGVASTAQRVEVRLTAKRGGYDIGERVTTAGLHVVPRNSANRSRRIPPYLVECP